jgi:hypothetical protein
VEVLCFTRDFNRREHVVDADVGHGLLSAGSQDVVDRHAFGHSGPYVGHGDEREAKCWREEREFHS